MRARMFAGMILAAAALAGCHDGYAVSSYSVGYSSGHHHYKHYQPRHATYSYSIVSPAYCPPVHAHHHHGHHGHHGHSKHGHCR